MPDLAVEAIPPATKVANAPTPPPISNEGKNQASNLGSVQHLPSLASVNKATRSKKATSRRGNQPDSSSGLTDTDNPSQLPTSEEKTQMQQIASLWSSKQGSTNKLRRGRDELASISNDLSKILYDFKTLLSRNGRGGKWAPFLRSARIPLATADRYVKKWTLSLAPPVKLLDEELSEPTTEAITKLVAQLKPKLVRTLTTQQSIAEFMAALGTCLKNARAPA